MRIVYGLGLLGAACLIACGSSSKGGTPGGDGSGGADSAGGSGNAGAGSHHAGSSSTGDAGDGNSGGDAGSGDLPPVVSTAKPHTAGGLVAGGTVGHSAHFTGVFSLGAAPGGNGLTTSKSQQLRGGVLGASQK